MTTGSQHVTTPTYRAAVFVFIGALVAGTLSHALGAISVVLAGDTLERSL